MEEEVRLAASEGGDAPNVETEASNANAVMHDLTLIDRVIGSRYIQVSRNNLGKGSIEFTRLS